MTTKTNLPVARILIHRKRSHLGLISALAFAVASCGSVMVSLAADVTSTWNAGSGDWGVAANWNPNSFFPKNGSHGFTFDAILNNGGTINLDQNIAIQKFTLTSGTLTGSKDLTTNELLTWTAGTMSGSGMTNANGGMSLNSSGVNLFLDTRTLNNAAGQTATWTNTTGSGGDIRFVNGAIFNNNGTFLAQSDQGIFSNGGGGGTFNNAGTFTRNNNSTTLTIGGQIIFNNTGTVNVQTGTLALQGGDSGNTTGAFNVSSGATLNLQSNFTFAAGSSFAGAGTVNFNSGTSDLNGSSYNVSAINVAGGTANFNTNASVVGINLTSGTLAGTGMLNASGLVTWSGGTMSGTGVTNANGGMSLVDGGPLGYLYLDTRTLDNAAGQTATWTTDPSNFGYSTFFQNGATLNNNGTFLVQSSNGIYNGGGGGGTFNNAGTFTRNNNNGTFTINNGVAFNNTGTVNVETGTLALQGGDTGNTTGAFNVSSGATLNFASNFTFTGTSLNGAGDVNFSGGTATFNSTNTASAHINLSGGTLSGPGTLTSSGLITWTGGVMSGSGVTNANGGMSLVDGGPNGYLFLDTRTLNNAAGQTATWTTDPSNFGYSTFFQNGATLNNNGTFLVQSSNGIYNGGGGGGTFNNAGTFTRNNNTGTFTINNGVAFNNTGTVNVETGTLALQGGDTGNTTGAFNASSGATLNLGGNFTFSASSSFAGAGTVIFSSGTSDLNGSSYNVSAINVAGGTANFNTNASVVAINLSSGTLGGSGTLDASGLLTWTGGVMSGSGVTNANGGMNIVDGGPNGYLYLDTRTLDNAAGQTATWTTDPSNFGYSTFFQNGATLNNNGTFLVQSSNGIYNGGGGGGTFNNAGTFTRNNNNGTFTINNGVAFNNTGTVNVETGTLALQGGDTGNTTGAFNVSSGATLNLQSNFTFAAGSSFAGAGTVNFNSGTSDLNGSSYNVSAINVAGGTANFNTNASVVGINLTSGTLAGTGTLNASGLVTWSGGTMSGTGVTNANGGMSLVDGGPNGYLYLDGRTLNNAAGQTATWTTDPSNFGYLFYFLNGATLNNNGTFFAQSNNGIYNAGGGGGTFNNAGIFTRNNNSGTLTIGNGITFNNTGTVDVESGTLALQGTISQHSGSTLTAGTWIVSNGATLSFQDGGSAITTNDANVTLSGAGSTFDAINGLNVNEGTFTLANGNTFMTAAGLINFGTIHVNDATSVLNVNGSLANAGTTTVQGTLSATSVGTGGIIQMDGGTLSAALTIHNGGSLIGSGITRVVSVEDGGAVSPGFASANKQPARRKGRFAPPGPLANGSAGLLYTGNLSLTSGANFVMDLNGTTPGTQYDQVAVNGTVNLGSSHLVLSLGFNPVAGTKFELIDNDSNDPVSGTFNGLPQGAIIAAANPNAGGGTFEFSINYFGGTGNDVVLEAIPEPNTWLSFLSGTALLLLLCRHRKPTRKKSRLSANGAGPDRKILQRDSALIL